MIKKIHYCWFGSEEPESVRKTVAHWRELNPDFEIIKWDESNTDVSAYEFGRRALEARKWGFLVDIIRPQKLVEEGGFYVDADIELTSSLNRLESYRDKLVMGYMLDCALGTAILYSPPGHPYLKDILAKYDHIRRDFWPRSNSVFTEYFINEVPGFLLDGKPFENADCKIFRKEFFEQPAFIKSRGISIHHACGSWNKEEASPFAFGTGASALQHAIKWAKRQYRAYRMLHSNEFYDSYAAACKGKRLPFDARKYYEPGNNAYGAVPGLPAFSIVVTCYNLEKYIEEALDSCCKQDYDGEWEVIVVDDCSNDKSRDVIQQYLAEHPAARVRFVPRETNGGVAAATDTGVAAAKYEWIVLADGDDVQLPERLSRAAETIKKNPDIKFLTMSMNCMCADGTLTGRQYYLSATDEGEIPQEICKASPEERVANMQAKHDILACTGASGLFHRDCYTKFGTLQGECPHHLEQDPILMFRAMLLGPVMGTRDLACNYRNHTTNLTNITLPSGVRGVMAFERHQDKYLILHTRTLQAELRDLEHATSHPDITDWPPDLLDRARQHLLQEIAFCGTRAEWWKSSWRSRLARARRAGQLKAMSVRLLPFPLFCLLKYWRKK